MDRGHHPLAHPLTFDEDVAVVGIAGKAVAAPVQFPIEFIQYHIGEYWRQIGRAHV